MSYINYYELYQLEFEEWKSKLPNTPFKLKIARKIKPDNWDNYWIKEMDEEVGRIFDIKDKKFLKGNLLFPHDRFGSLSYPYQCFDVIKDNFYYAI